MSKKSSASSRTKRSASTARTSPAKKKAASKKAPAKKKAASKKTPAKKAASKKTASKKTASKKAPARRVRKSKEPLVIGSPSLMQAMSAAHRREGRTVGFVPTMGALHEGHLALIREARLRADLVVVSIFVNPKQFNEKKDLSAYPRDLAADVEMCKSAGVDVVLAPPAEAIYPSGSTINVSAGTLGRVLEGKSRPGHFDGVLTVCTALFSIVQPHFAVFGEKDFQQLTLIKRLVRDLHFPIEIVPMPVLRDVDGLALSSRNVRLNKRNRQRALCLFKALTHVQERVFEGEVRTRVLLREAKALIKNTPDFRLDYCNIVEPYGMGAIDRVNDGARLVLAGSIGEGKKEVRLLDNGPLFVGRDADI